MASSPHIRSGNVKGRLAEKFFNFFDLFNLFNKLNQKNFKSFMALEKSEHLCEIFFLRSFTLPLTDSQGCVSLGKSSAGEK
jgi:hypothetical protein